MEGRKYAFGIASLLYVFTITTDASCGEVMGCMAAYAPAAGDLVQHASRRGHIRWKPEPDSTLCSCSDFGVSLQGSWSVRTPETFGKKIEGKEVKTAMPALIATSAVSDLQRPELCHSISEGRIWMPRTGNSEP